MGKTEREREREDFLFSHCNLDDLLFGDGRELPGMAVWLFFIYMSYCDRHVLNVNILSHTSFQHFPVLTLENKHVCLQALSVGCALCLIVLSISLKTLNAQDVVSVVSGCWMMLWGSVGTWEWVVSFIVKQPPLQIRKCIDSGRNVPRCFDVMLYDYDPWRDIPV